MFLSRRSRQKCLKAIGLYDGPINGKWDKRTKAAVKKLQDKYFGRRQDRDGGKYGKNTDILLRSAYNCRKEKSPYFKLEEFRCPCGHCTGYPAVVSWRLVRNLNNLRKQVGSLSIASGLRCKHHNAELSGSSSRSYHVRGMAADVYGRCTDTVAERKKIIRLFSSKPDSGYTYANINGNAPNMGTSVHCGVTK